MEVNQENIERVAEVLRMGKFNESLLKVQDISKLAEDLIKQNPGLTPEEIGQVYEEQQMQLQNNSIEQVTNENEGQDRDE